MRIIIFGLLILLYLNGFSQTHTGAWNLNQVSSDSLTEISHFFFADSSVGYLGGSFTSDAISSTQVQRWYRTIDGGHSWLPITFEGIPSISPYINSSSNPTINSIFLTGYKYIYFSLNYGMTWDSIRCNLNLDQFFTMFTERQGLGIGGSIYDPIILKTLNGGYTFPMQLGDSLFTSSLAASQLLSGYFSAAGFSDQSHGTFIVADNTINSAKGLTTIVTNDAGLSWVKYHTDFPQFSNDTLFGNIEYQKGTSNLWLMPYKLNISNVSDYFRWRAYPNRLSYCFSSDYGKSWSYDTSFSRRCAAVYGVSPANIWMLLYQQNIEEGTSDIGHCYTIVHSIDTGATWDIDSSALKYGSDLGGVDARAIYFSDVDHGWVAGIHKGMPYIFQYHPFKNSIIEHHIGVQEQLPVFPNPAQNKITINLPVGFYPIEASIFDVIGRQYFAPYKINNNIITIDTHDLPPGICLVIVKHTYGTNTTRFLLQK